MKPTDANSANARLLLQGGFINQLAAGIYTYLPLGLRVLERVKDIVRDEMDAIDGQEILMPALIPKSEWERTGRWEEEVAFKTEGYGKKDYALGWSHEEVVTPLVKTYVKSYKDFPVSMYQIQTKFRNEARAKSGLLRGREFVMKDMYSFHLNEADFEDYYEKSKEAYLNVFDRCGLDARIVEAGGGSFTDLVTHEFQVATPYGEDIVFGCDSCDYAKNKELVEHENGDKCPSCGKGKIEAIKSIEVGNIFPLETKYTDATNFDVAGEDGKPIRLIMGCYGIGISRLVGSITEVHHDEKGIVWPKTVAPFDIEIVTLSSKDETVQGRIEEVASALHDDLEEEGVEVLWDERDTSAGAKFADADLIGIPLRLVVSEKTLAEDSVEWKYRSSDETRLVKLNDLESEIETYLNEE